MVARSEMRPWLTVAQCDRACIYTHTYALDPDRQHRQRHQGDDEESGSLDERASEAGTGTTRSLPQSLLRQVGLDGAQESGGNGAEGPQVLVIRLIITTRDKPRT